MPYRWVALIHFCFAMWDGASVFLLAPLQAPLGEQSLLGVCSRMRRKAGSVSPLQWGRLVEGCNLEHTSSTRHTEGLNSRTRPHRAAGETGAKWGKQRWGGRGRVFKVRLLLSNCLILTFCEVITTSIWLLNKP